MSIGLFLRLFFFFGILFGFAAAAVDGQPGQFKPFAGVFFGAGMAIGLGYLHAKGSREAGRPPGDLSVRDEIQTVLSLPPSDAVPLMERAVHAMEEMKLERVDPAQLEVEARTPFSWSSYGEKVLLKARPEDDGSRITIGSSPSWPLTIVDNGKSRRNVNQLAEWLRTHAGSAPEPG